MICKDAKEMLRLRREIAANKELSPFAAGSLIQAIDEQRWTHFDQNNGCHCWDNAILALNKAAA
jgi:hypothetical protein